MITDKQLADLLGAEVDEDFMLKSGMTKIRYRIEEGLKVYMPNLKIWQKSSLNINELYELEVIKLPWKPKSDEVYYTIDRLQFVGWRVHRYLDNYMDKKILSRGEVYRTQEEVEQAVKELGWEVK